MQSAFAHPLGEPEDPLLRSARLRLRDNDRRSTSRSQPLTSRLPSARVRHSQARAPAADMDPEERCMREECKDLGRRLLKLAEQINQSHGTDQAAVYQASQLQARLCGLEEKLKLADLKRPPAERKRRELAAQQAAPPKTVKEEYMGDMFQSTTKAEYPHRLPFPTTHEKLETVRPRASTDVTRWSKNILNHFWIYEASR